MNMDVAINKDVLESIQETLKKHTALLKLLVKKNNSSKVEELIDEVQMRGRMEVGVVERFLQTSRPWALRIMRDVAKQEPRVYFKLGDSRSQTPSSIRWISKDYEEYMTKIDGMWKDHNTVSMEDVMNTFNVNFCEARTISEIYCEEKFEYLIDETKCEMGVPVKKGVEIRPRIMKDDDDNPLTGNDG